jgi:hypothetical protein
VIRPLDPAQCKYYKYLVLKQEPLIESVEPVFVVAVYAAVDAAMNAREFPTHFDAQLGEYFDAQLEEYYYSQGEGTVGIVGIVVEIAVIVVEIAGTADAIEIAEVMIAVIGMRLYGIVVVVIDAVGLKRRSMHSEIHLSTMRMIR